MPRPREKDERVHILCRADSQKDKRRGSQGGRARGRSQEEEKLKKKEEEAAAAAVAAKANFSTGVLQLA